MVDLMICGAMRSGTTSLFANLACHPEVATLTERQLFIEGRYVGWPFASPVFAHYQLGYDPGLYSALVSAVKKPGNSIVLTKQPYFMIFPHIAFGLREQLPAAKLIFILREQPEMLASAFHVLYRTEKFEHMTLENFLPRRILSGDCTKSTSYELPTSRQAWHFEYWNVLGGEVEEGTFALERGFYYEHLKRFFLLFPSSQILTIRYTDFAADPQAVLLGICEFAGLDPSFEFPSANTVFSRGGARPPLGAELRERIEEFYAPSNKRLFRLLGWKGF